MRRFIGYMIVAPFFILMVMVGAAYAVVLAICFVTWDITPVFDATNQIVENMTWLKFRMIWVVSAILSLIFLMSEMQND